jgi:hypothetical protein
LKDVQIDEQDSESMRLMLYQDDDDWKTTDERQAMALTGLMARC